MVMSIKDKVLLAWLLMLMVLSFLLGHFWSYTIFAIQKAVALGLLPWLVVCELAAGIAGFAFFP